MTSTYSKQLTDNDVDSDKNYVHGKIIDNFYVILHDRII